MHPFSIVAEHSQCQHGILLHVHEAKDFDWVACKEVLERHPVLIDNQAPALSGARWPVLHQAIHVASQ